MSGFGPDFIGSDLAQIVVTFQDANRLAGSLQQTLANGVIVLTAPPTYAFGALPSTAATGQFAYCSDGRKPAEGAGLGTGIPVWFDVSGVWYSYCDGTPAAV